MFKDLIKNLAVNKRLTITLIVIMTISLGILAQYSGAELEELLLKEKKEHLISFAQRLDEHLSTSFKNIIVKQGASELTAHEQIEILNKQLLPIVDALNSEHSDISYGYYSREFRQIVAVGPQASEGKDFQVSEDSPLLELFNTEKEIGSKFQAGIVNSTEPVYILVHPIYRNNQLIGHSWAEVRRGDVMQAVADQKNKIYSVALGLTLVVTFFISWITGKQKKTLSKFAEDLVVKEGRIENLHLFPELNPVLDKVQQTTRELWLEREKLESILNGLPVGIFMFNINQEITFANKASERFIGFSAGQMLGLDKLQFQDLVCEKAPEGEFLDKVEEVLETKKPQIDYLQRFRNFSNRKVLARVSTYPLVEATGEAKGTISILEDVTDSEQLKLLWKQEEVVFTKLNYGLILADRDLNCLTFNTAAEALLDYPRARAQAKKITEIVAELPEALRAINHALNNGLSIDSLEIKLGETPGKYILINFDILKSNQSEILGYVVILKDITGLKRHTQIIAEQEKLASIGQMAAGMAHEMRNPLTAIKGFVHLLSEKPICKEEVSVFQYLQIVKEEIDRLNSIIGDFLLFARPAKPKLEEISINDLLLETIFLIESQCLMNNVSIKQSLSSQNLIVQGDKNQLKQVLLNLFSNSVDALKETTTKQIKINTEIVDQGSVQGNYVRIEIEDTGLGISKENLGKLFTPFFTTKEHGTGLGLSGSLQIVQNHHGLIKAESQEGLGTKFMIDLPQFRLS